ncbi:hypothetical protein [Bifidobacterium thermophilum]|uniref:hypothetical protein n=1 Tax=Bifidobacterium thermophilum TaxID=33905 RepID=UPI003F91F91B
MQPIHPCDWPDIVDRSDDRRQAEQAARRNHADCLRGLPLSGYRPVVTPLRIYAAITGETVAEIQHMGHARAVIFAPIAGEYRIHVADIYDAGGQWRILFDKYRPHTGERLRAEGAGTLQQALDFTAHALNILYPERDEREYRRD